MPTFTHGISLWLASSILLSFSTISLAATNYDTSTNGNISVQTLLNGNCATSGCHNGTQSPDLTSYANATSGLTEIRIIARAVTLMSMPPAGPLSQSLRDILSAWETNGFAESNRAPSSVIDAPNGSATISVGEAVTFSGTGLDHPADNPADTLSHQWNFGANSGVSNSSVENPGAITFNTPGVFTVTYRASETQAGGLVSPANGENTVIITVEDVVNPPPPPPPPPPPTAGGTSFHLHNPGQVFTNVTIEFYQNGILRGSAADGIAPNRSTHLTAVTPSDFSGSAVVSAGLGQQVIALSSATDASTSLDYYLGAPTANTTATIPLALKGILGFSSTLQVQNASQSTSMVNISYPPSACAESVTLAPFSAVSLNTNGNACLPSGFVGAATLNSTQPIATTVEHSHATNPLIAATANGSDASTRLFVPLVYQDPLLTTGIAIQNISGASTNVTVSYLPHASSLGSPCAPASTLGANQFGFFSLPADCNPQNGWLGTAVITADQPVVAQAALYDQTGNTDNTVYAGLSQANGGDRLVFPLVTRGNNQITYLLIQNTEAQASNVTCAMEQAGTFSTGTIAANALGIIDSSSLVNGYIGSAVCTTDPAGGNIVGIAIETDNGIIRSYEGVNNGVGSASLFFPQVSN